jgi:hypothetical protein
MRETWYVLEDGRVVDPAEVLSDDVGDMHHKSGVYVAMRGNAYSSRSVDPDEERAKAAASEQAQKPDEKEAGETEIKDLDAGQQDMPKATREMTAETPKRAYKTRKAG